MIESTQSKLVSGNEGLVSGEDRGKRARGILGRHQFYHSSPSYVEAAWVGLRQAERWIIWRNAFNKLETECRMTLHAFVMLETHVHILFSIQKFEENFTMAKLQEFLSHELRLKRDIQASWEFAEEVLESPLLSEKIESYQQLLNTYRYIYRNPIEAGVVKRAEDYQYSSLSLQLGSNILFSNVIDPVNLIQNPGRILNWLNQDGDAQLFTGYRTRVYSAAQSTCNSDR